MKKWLFVLVPALVLICSLSYAEQVQAPTELSASNKCTLGSTPGWPRIDVGVGYWYTWNKLNSYVWADEDWIEDGVIYARKGDKASELENKLDSGMLVINGEAYLFWRLFVDGFVGLGNFKGNHKDYDWYKALDPEPYQLSESDADGKALTWNANANIRLIDGKDQKGYLDLSLGYQYYRDNIEHLRNSTLLIYNYESVDIPINGHDSQDKYTFDGFRLGARGRCQLIERLALKGNVGLVPWMKAENNAYWNLRDTYFDSTADGTSFDATLALEFKITKNLFIEAGYKYMYFDTGKGPEKVTMGDESETYDDAFSVDATRHGFYAMGRLKI